MLSEMILEYESDFFSKSFCDNKQNLENRIHDDFIEFGKSGQMFNKTSIINFLNNLDENRDIEIENFKLKNVSHNVLMAHYISNEKEIKIKALRTSIWVYEDSDWKLYFHQGTIIEEMHHEYEIR